MTQDEIIEMAAEIWNAGSSFPIPSSDDILHFAKLVAEKAFQNGYEKGIAAFNDAVLIEREACAKVCEVFEWGKRETYAAEQCAAAIRARGQA